MATVLYHLLVTLPMCFIGWFIVWYSYTTGTTTDKVVIWIGIGGTLISSTWLWLDWLGQEKTLERERTPNRDRSIEENQKIIDELLRRPRYPEAFAESVRYLVANPKVRAPRSQPASQAQPARKRESTKNCPPDKWE